MNPKPCFDKRNLWPWRYWMTIGLGVLATEKRRSIGSAGADMAILVGDTMGSFGDVDSHPRLHKIIMMPEQKVYAVASGSIDKAAELMPMVAGFVGDLKPEKRTYGGLMTAIAAACLLYKQNKFGISELPKLRLNVDAIDPLKVTPEVNAVVQKRWSKFSIGCDLVIAAFDKDDNAWLFRLDGRAHQVDNVSFPGFAAVGSGSDNAIFWLSRRGHTLGMHPLRSAYHAYEAKLMAEGSAHVNEHIDMVIASQRECWFSTTHRSGHGIPEHPEINLQTLRRMFRRYGVRDTENIGKSNVTPSTAQTSEPEP